MSENRRRRVSSGSKQRGNGSDPTGTSRNSHTKSAYQRSTSYDKVRRLVKEEGRNARNLVQWSVPVEDSDDSDTAAKTAPRRKLKARTSILKARKSPRDSSTEEKRSSSTEGRSLEKTEKKTKKIDLRARYWAFLFDNLQRAVDEVYHTCEVDESIVECKEVIMILKSATRDFEALIKRINVQTAFENADKDKKPTSLVWEVRKMSSSPAKHRAPSWPGDARTPPRRQRPTSLAWEVRKTSPGKALGTSPTPDSYRSTPSPVNRILSFNNQGKSGSPVPFVETGSSWADKVKGRTTKPVPKAALQPKLPQQAEVETKTKNAVLEEINEDDTEGWETVQRGKQGKQNKSRNSSSSNSPANHGKQIHSNATPKVTQEKIPVVITDVEKNNTEVRESRTDSEKENHPVESSNIQKKEVDIREQDPAILEVTSTTEVKTEIEENEKETELVPNLDEAVIAALNEEETLTSELEKYQEEALASAIAEEENLTKELEEEENKEIEVVETDEGDSDLGNTMSSLESSQRTMDWNDLCAEFEEKRSQQGMSWGDMVDLDDNLEARPPGHALLMHEKLSSPSRKKTRAESRKIHEERQAQAKKKREILLEEKGQKLRSLHERIAEVQEWKEVLIQQRKKEMDEKLKRAEEKRQVQLQAIVKKARTEDIKANEIAFINSLEAQNKKIDILSRHQGIEARLQDLIDERQRKTEEKQAKEEAAHERRRQLEEERQARLEAMQKQRKIQEEKIYQIRDARDRAREAAAKEKARDRVQRLSALTAAQLAKEEEIQKKIQQKQDGSTRRHTEHLEQKREKAVELSMLRHYRTTDLAPQQKPYDKKKVCTLCNMPIPSEVYLLSHLKGRKHALAFNEKHADLQLSEEDRESYSLKYIVQAPSDEPDAKQIAEKERQKGLRKRARKLRQRMSSRGKEYETNLPTKSQAGGSSECRANDADGDHGGGDDHEDDDVDCDNSGDKDDVDGAVSYTHLDVNKRQQQKQDGSTRRHTEHLEQKREKAVELSMLRHYRTTDLAPQQKPTLCNATNVLKLAIKGCYENCQYCLYSNKLGPLIDSLMHQLISIIPDDEVSPLNTSGSSDNWKPPSDPVASHLMQVLSTVFLCLSKNGPTATSSSTSEKRGEAQKKKADTFQQWGQDVISYFVCSGVVDKLTTYFNGIRGTIDEEEKSADFLQHGLALLAAVTKFVTVTSSKSNDVFASKHEDSTQLIVTFQATGLGGIVSLLYGVLLHGGSPSRGDAVIPPELPEHTLSVVNAGIRMLSNIALLDLTILQSALGEEGISLEFRHIATYLIWYCSHYQNYSDLLHEVMLIVGYFTVFHHENQIIVQSGKTPTLLQQLCALPFQYFSDPRLMAILFPTLIACCHNNQENKIILEQEMSCMLLATFIEEKLRDKEKAKLLPTAAKAKGKKNLPLFLVFPFIAFTF
ncbi:S phase cyclin A-associated protein in the endoplasmic reticulum-like [Anneissia japonica]|uniref:S phase cyclin A-associated protein in the endoplasmic reticulum-like n=1 Tax=Anneissia japonica TaxID=1529436 RepID=UPI00142575A7|nr:S phase cyclin A-associated protein in the endoplasmic reticulum-like [Anneissia japonica]